MKTELQIAKKNIEIKDNKDWFGGKPHLLNCQEHLQFCKRFLEKVDKYLERLGGYGCGYHKQLEKQMINDKKDNQRVIKLYKENEIE